MIKRSVVKFKKSDERGDTVFYDGEMSKVCHLYEILDDVLERFGTGEIRIAGECTYKIKGYKIVGQIPDSLLKRNVSGIYVKCDWMAFVDIYLFNGDIDEKLNSIKDYSEDLRREMMEVLKAYENKIGLPIYSIGVSKNCRDTEFETTFYDGVRHFSISV